MAALPFSDAQRAALVELRGGVRKTTAEIRKAIDVGKSGVIGVMQALYQRGPVRFAGQVGRGHWHLTQLGERTVDELAATEEASPP